MPIPHSKKGVWSSVEKIIKLYQYKLFTVKILKSVLKKPLSVYIVDMIWIIFKLSYIYVKVLESINDLVFLS